MQPCTDPTDQVTVCFGDCGGPRHPGPNQGMLQFLHHPGQCLQGNPADGTMTTAACNNLSAGQRFFSAGGALVNGAHENKMCVTASNTSCTAANSSSVTCSPGAPITLEKCVSSWPGSPIPNTPDPFQVWDAHAPHGESGALVLKATWIAANHPKHGPGTVNSTSCLSVTRK